MWEASRWLNKQENFRNHGGVVTACHSLAGVPVAGAHVVALAVTAHVSRAQHLQATHMPGKASSGKSRSCGLQSSCGCLVCGQPQESAALAECGSIWIAVTLGLQ